MKSENNLDADIVAKSPEFHKTGGLFSVTSGEVDPILKEYLTVSKMSGIPQTFGAGREPFHQFCINQLEMGSDSQLLWDSLSQGISRTSI